MVMARKKVRLFQYRVNTEILYNRVIKQVMSIYKITFLRRTIIDRLSLTSYNTVALRDED